MGGLAYSQQGLGPERAAAEAASGTEELLGHSIGGGYRAVSTRV